jgi:hypothetical protein
MEKIFPGVSFGGTIIFKHSVLVKSHTIIFIKIKTFPSSLEASKTIILGLISNYIISVIFPLFPLKTLRTAPLLRPKT